MTADPSIDSVLVQWGERLFYPPNRIVANPPAYVRGTPAQRKAAFIRRRIEATVRRAPQVMVKLTGGGRSMGAIAAHLRYITKNGRLDFEDERGVTQHGKEELHDLERQWQFGGSFIGKEGLRREAFNLMLSMPRGTDPLSVLVAAREFAKAEFADHSYVMVLHDHQANPHVHLSIRAESKHGRRLNPRKANLRRWREVFAEQLRGRGIDAEATRQATRGQLRNNEPLWRIKAREEGRLRRAASRPRSNQGATPDRDEARAAWAAIEQALAVSDALADRALARAVHQFVRTIDRQVAERTPMRSPALQPESRSIDIDRTR